MKKILFIIGVLSIFTVGSVFASPVKKLDSQTLGLIQALKANPNDTDNLFKAGNTVMSGTVQAVSRELTRYTVTVQQCMVQGCLGGATLVIDQKLDLRPGLIPPYTYKTQFMYLR